MGDDGYSAVNLNFAFPYYDKTFNRAYMLDNGIVSFLEPNTTNAMSSWQWNSQPISQTQAKYFIAPLWADIAPVSQTTYGVTHTATSAKFAWNNIAEYYSRGGILRLNSFSVEINENGDIATKYFGLNLRTSNISIGLKGDSDYTQIAYYPYGTVFSSQADWSANTKIAAPVAPVIPKQEPIPEPVIEQPIVSDPIQTTQIVQNTIQNPTQTVQNPVQNIVQNITQNPVAPIESKSEKKSVAKIQQVDMSVVDAAVSIAMTSASQSVNEQVIVSNSFSLSNTVVLNNRQTSQMTSQNQSNGLDNSQQMSVNSDKKDAMDMVLLNNLERQESRQDQKDKGINKGISPNLGLGIEVPLFATYAQVMLPDAPFYAPKAVYRNQKVVDNSKILRSLSNDAKFEQMINFQYR